MSSIIDLKGIVFTRENQRILGPLDWLVTTDQRWVVLGANGSGKSTLTRVASLGLHPSSGDVTVLGHKLGSVDIRPLRARIGLSSASLADQLRPQLTAGEIVRCGLYGALEPWWHTYTDADVERSAFLLKQVGLPGYDHRTVATLSSGERQRMLLARCLMPKPEMLILDEPTAGLDIAGREALIVVLDDIGSSAGPSWVMVTHRVEDIPSTASHCLFLMPDGRALSGPITALLTSENLSAAFGLDLALQRHGRRWTAVPVASS